MTVGHMRRKARVPRIRGDGPRYEQGRCTPRVSGVSGPALLGPGRGRFRFSPPTSRRVRADSQAAIGETADTGWVWPPRSRTLTRLERVSEHLSRLEMLHFLLRVQEQQAEVTRRWIAAEERREAERRQREQTRPPQPDWVLELGIGVGAKPVQVHAGHCWAIGDRRRPITRDQALAALGEGVEACPHCRPDTDLGILE